MPAYETEQKALDAALQEEQNGKGAIVLGAVLALMASITGIWIWVGWRDGTWFWFWWSAGLCGIGMTLVAAGTALRLHGQKRIAALTDQIRAALEQGSGAENKPSGQDVQRPAA